MINDNITQPIKPVKLKKKYTTGQLLKLKVSGATITTLATLTDTTKSNISQRLRKYINKLELLNDPESLKNFIRDKSKTY